MRTAHRGEKGYALVELLVAIAIMVILIGLVVSNLAGSASTAEEKAMAHEKDVVQSVIDVYNTQNVDIEAEPTIAAVATPQKCGSDNPDTFGQYLRRETKYRYSWSDNGEDLEVSK